MSDTGDHRSVFVVHGRNAALRRSMFDFLRSINLAPMEWTRAVELTGEGSPYIGQILDAAFDHATAVVVLMTPDEVAYLQPQYGYGDEDPEIRPAAQARPNVLFEAGMALGRNAAQAVLVQIGQVRPFSDVAGRHAIRLTNEVASRQALAKRLETAGCDVNLAGTDWHTAGDFDPPPPPGVGWALGRRVPSSSAPRSIDFSLNYVNKGGNRVDKLQVINRGVETAYEVTLDVPTGAALDVRDAGPINKIPGGGKSVTIDVLNHNRSFSAQHDSAFDVAIRAKTESGDEFVQDVFLDLNGWKSG